MNVLPNPLHEDTHVLHGDHHLSEHASVVAPIYYSATFAAADANEFATMANTPRHSAYYTRYGNPGHERVAAIVAGLEQTETALLTGSGMGAISTTVLALVQAGDHVIAQSRHYMSTSKLFEEVLPRFGVEVSIVAQHDVAAFAAAIRHNTRLIMLETPANPTLSITDLAAVARLAKEANVLRDESGERGIVTIADNTFASPLNQKPHALGIDIVIHSATKYLGGHHDLTAGVICCSHALAELIWKMHTTLGAVLSPMDAWLLLRGLRTLAVRIERINATALALAAWLETQARVAAVHYPGLASHPQHRLAARQMTGYGAVIAIAIDGGFDATSRFVAALRLATHAVSLGGVETLVVHSAAMWAGTMSEAQMVAACVEPNFVRLSVGLEHVDDLRADLAAALAQIG